MKTWHENYDDAIVNFLVFMLRIYFCVKSKVVGMILLEILVGNNTIKKIVKRLSEYNSKIELSVYS